MNYRERLLARPAVYRAFKRIVLPEGVLESLVATHFVVPDGGRVLDLGCGFGDYAPFFSGRCQYVGIDHNASYIETAKNLNGSGDATFIVADVVDHVVSNYGPYDLVMISGVLHHLPSADILQLARNVRSLLSPSGKFVALEAVFDPEQSLLARIAVASDRGRYVRDQEGYRNLLEQVFSNVETVTVNGMLRIPYSHVVISAKA
jgi:SAM-dependent methyltransferase